LHLSISDSTGKTLGGHLQDGSLIFTTAEILLGELEDWMFTRLIDPDTSYDELFPRNIDQPQFQPKFLSMQSKYYPGNIPRFNGEHSKKGA